VSLTQILAVSGGDVDTRRRGRTIIMISLLLLGLITLALPVVATRPDPLPSIIAVGMGLLLISGAIYLARTGRVGVAGWVLVGFSLLSVAIPILLRSEVTSTLFYLLLPVIIAGMVLRPWQVWPVLAVAFAILATDVLGTDPELLRISVNFDIVVNCALMLTTLGMIAFLGARVTAGGFTDAAQARSEAEQAALRLAELNNSLEQRVSDQTAELRLALSEVETRAAVQTELLAENAAQRNAIRELSIPVLPVSRDTLVMPLVGALDSARISELQTRALQAIEQFRARRLLLDITGVPVVDTHVAQGLIQAILATRLLGAEPILIGVRPEVAQTLVALGVDLADVHTEASLASALEH
jgi:rsbT co-antagonist protein RsbR